MGFFFPLAKMFRKGHSMERTAHVPESQCLKNKASDII